MVVCFIGDSLTQGIGDELALGWVGRLARESYLKDPTRSRSLTVCNLGLRSDTSTRIAVRWREETDRRRRQGEDMAFVFSFGAADGKFDLPGEESLTAARQVLEGAAALGQTLYASPPPAFDAAWSGHIRQLGAQVRGLCAELGVPAFDLHAPLAAEPAYMASLAADGIHPDAAGYERMAELLSGWSPLARLLGL
ncbi:Lysophospholipase L1 [Humidesulfovibrio mexicanus]|uniref:Lysophospholipase L1 n=1 Tax=Humidesulfovibrio mexicanus TaxID=147047 RepID=A0A238Y064_9BACT|nr:GDSL-type esterase/lipase family protein [Humidesulfovibrio mexicanus]SNR63689.1 Lysophospholipase L1 [Humidesulfovibrio mexicanus]